MWRDERTQTMTSLWLTLMRQPAIRRLARFVAGLDTNLTGAASLIYGSFVGGSGGEAAFDVGLDDNGNIYFFGFTESANDFVAAGQGYQDQIGSINDRDHFLLKLDPSRSSAQQLVYSTFIGGSGDEEEVGKIHVGGNGRVWVTGNTTSADFLNPQANLPPARRPGCLRALDRHQRQRPTIAGLVSIPGGRR